MTVTKKVQVELMSSFPHLGFLRLQRFWPMAFQRQGGRAGINVSYTSIAMVGCASRSLTLEFCTPTRQPKPECFLHIAEIAPSI